MTEQVSIPKYTGAIKLDYVNHKNDEDTIDIASFVMRLEISADVNIDSSFCDILLSDSMALDNKRQFQAGDIITVSLTHDGEYSYERRYRILRLGTYVIHDREKNYVIKCVSDFYYQSIHSKINRSYNGNVSEIAKTIFDEFSIENSVIWEKSSNAVSVVIPQWSPIKTIKWLAKRASTPEGIERFMFFQDTKQMYTFASQTYLKALWNSNVKTYRYLQNQDWKNGAPNKDSMMSKIQHLVIRNAFDISEELDNGNIVNTFIDVDINTKSMRQQTNNYWDTYNKRSMNPINAFKIDEFGPGNIIRRNMPSNINNFPPRPQDHSDECFDYSRATQIEITVLGDPTIDIGMVVNIEIPQQKPHTEDQDTKLDHFWSGRYMIVAKRDYIDQSTHSMTLRLVKESLGDF